MEPGSPQRPDDESTTRPLFSDGDEGDENHQAHHPTQPDTGHPTEPLDTSHQWEATRPLPETTGDQQQQTPELTPVSGLDSSAELPTEAFNREPEPGQVLFGRYRILSRLGRGGMGSVWLVHHLELEADRALKLIVSNIAQNPEARTRFKREARVMARLVHPNAVTVHDARLAGDVVFIEMEFVPGKSLNQVLVTGHPMPLDWVTRLLEQLCDVLQAAHRLGIVHRDLKPSNLMLVDGRPPGKEQLKVLDFGIAKILNPDETATDELHTRTGAMPYTPQYASPEQITGCSIDTRSDLYSLGIILFEMLTGYRPFKGPQAAFHHVTLEAPTFAEVNPELKLPPDIERVVRWALAKDPEKRPATAQEFFEAFRRALPPELAGVHASGSWKYTGGVSAGTLPEHSGASFSPIARRAASPTAPTQPGHQSLFRDELTATQPATAKAPAADSYFQVPGTAKTGVDSPPARLPAWLAWLIPLALVAIIAVVVIPDFRKGKGKTEVAELGPALPANYRAEDLHNPADGNPPPVLIHNPTGARLIRLKGGQFNLGDDFDTADLGPKDDQPAHPVILSSYYMMETEVTNGMLETYFEQARIPPENRPKRWLEIRAKPEQLGLNPSAYPAVGLTWEEADAFARWMGGRLPTEAQWEYAARAGGEPRLFVWGNQPRPSRTRANIDSAGEHLSGFVIAGSYPQDSSPQGIKDLTGNVREWCRDWLAPYPAASEKPLTDPEGPAEPPAGESPARHVIRGGSFLSWSDRFYTTGPRSPGDEEQTALELCQDGSAADLGFRVVLEWPKEQPGSPAAAAEVASAASP